MQHVQIGTPSCGARDLMHPARQHALDRETQAAQARHRIETNGHHSLRSMYVIPLYTKKRTVRKFQHAVRTFTASSDLTVLTGMTVRVLRTLLCLPCMCSFSRVHQPFCYARLFQHVDVSI